MSAVLRLPASPNRDYQKAVVAVQGMGVRNAALQIEAARERDSQTLQTPQGRPMFCVNLLVRMCRTNIQAGLMAGLPC